MKTLLFLFITIFVVQTPGSDSTLIALRKQVIATDKLLKGSKQLILLAKLTGKKNLGRVYKEKWPEETEYSYNVLKDKAGKVIMVAQLPTSQSGDWMLSYRHYFDENGNTYCFKKDESHFDNNLKGGVAFEIITKFYDDTFKLLSQKTRYTDKDDKSIKRGKNDMPFRDDKYTIYKNVTDCLKAYNITL